MNRPDAMNAAKGSVDSEDSDVTSSSSARYCPDPATLHDVAPQAALAAVRSFQGPLLVDLDETLYLRNSTEDFIDCARPAFLAAIVLKALDWIKPWRRTGGDLTSDVWRVRLVMTLFPWTIWLWKRRVSRLAERYINKPLVTALHAHEPKPIVVTVGFKSIVTPLVEALGLGEAKIIAVRVSRLKDRLRGKLGLTMDALGEDTVRRALVLTDSIDDLPLLNACARPVRTVWPGAYYRRALSDIYLPGLYLTRVKRPGERYILRGILQEDFAFWLLSSVGLAGFPFLHAVGLLFLLASFWTIYERGYVDNDQIASRYEQEPKLTAAFHEAPVATPRWTPWVWALIAGTVGTLILRWPALPTPTDLIKWVTVLLATHGWFLLYNRLDKLTRVWLYLGLQLARSAAFAVMVPVVAIGAVALGAHVLAKWLPYYVYRFGGKNWPETKQPLARLSFFVVMALLALTQGTSVLLNWATVALLGWNLFRARDDLRAALRKAGRLDRTSS